MIRMEHETCCKWNYKIFIYLVDSYFFSLFEETFQSSRELLAESPHALQVADVFISSIVGFLLHCCLRDVFLIDSRSLKD